MLYFITSNKDKIFLAKSNLAPLGIEIATKPFAIPEIQSDNASEIATRKAIDAFTLIQEPLFVTDDSWYIPALRGFPGSYMKDMNKWLTADDFLRLLEPYDNREIILRQTLCFTDGKETKVFSQENKGRILRESKGKGVPSVTITTFRDDNKSLAECFADNEQPISNTKIWKDFGQWYLSRQEPRE